MKKDFLLGTRIESIYFGGGTPSVLAIEDIVLLLNELNKVFDLSSVKEITFEGNPDDLSADYLNSLYQIGINRLSIGIQTSNNKLLKFLNRRHNFEDSKTCLDVVSKIFPNRSCDLIFGLPGLTIHDIDELLDLFLSQNIPHISCYQLSYEEKTRLYKKLQSGDVIPLSDDICFEQYMHISDRLRLAGYEHYEISNFSKLNYNSKHNSSYWIESEYLGLGPSAHSYSIDKRFWNVSNISTYMNSIDKGLSFFEEEVLTEIQKYNEYIMKRLRTQNGILINDLKIRFNSEIYLKFLNIVEKLPISNNYSFNTKIFKLTESGFFVSDSIISKFILD